MSARTSPIASAVPGRIRLRHPALRQPDRHCELTESLAVLEGMRVAEGNPAVGSLLVVYDPASLAPADAEARVAAAAVLAPASPAHSSTEPGVAPASPRRFDRTALNRAAKLGMLGSMAVSMAALTTSRRLHAGAGAAFLTLMLVHIAIHRRRLFQ